MPSPCKWGPTNTLIFRFFSPVPIPPTAHMLHMEPGTWSRTPDRAAGEERKEEKTKHVLSAERHLEVEGRYTMMRTATPPSRHHFVLLLLLPPQPQQTCHNAPSCCCRHHHHHHRHHLRFRAERQALWGIGVLSMVGQIESGGTARGKQRMEGRRRERRGGAQKWKGSCRRQ